MIFTYAFWFPRPKGERFSSARLAEKYPINLQLFGEEKTEQATPKKKDDARKKGQVMQSKEVTAAASLLGAVAMLKWGGPFIFDTFVEAIYFISNSVKPQDLSSVTGALRVFLYMLFFIIKGSFLPILAAFTISLAVAYAQVGFLFTTEVLRPKFERLNPIEGLKKMFSMRSLVELIKSLLKISLVGYVGYSYLMENLQSVMRTSHLQPIQFSYLLYTHAIQMAFRMSLVILLLAVADYLYQRYEYNKNLKMSKQEIKEEYKMSEGDPQIKAKIKERQRQAAMRRMMQDVPKADVIITNPTHFAVAIRYDEKEREAPYVLAKGADFVAFKIRERAQEHRVELIENKPLAQALYKEVEVGRMIPPELFEGVAQILAYVYSLKDGRQAQ